MKIKELIKLTAETVGEEDTARYISGEAISEIACAKQNVELLLRCYNLIVDELACEYLPLKREEAIDAVNGKIYFSSLSLPPIRILNVYNKRGQKVPYKLVNDYIKVDEREVSVEYCHKLNFLKEEDDCPYSNGIIGPYTLAFGMASQYCLEKGRLNDSEIFQQKYLSSIRSRVAKRGNFKLPIRRWRG